MELGHWRGGVEVGLKVVVLKFDLSGVGIAYPIALAGRPAVEHLLDVLKLGLCSVPSVYLDTLGQALRHEIAPSAEQGVLSVLVYQILGNIKQHLFHIIHSLNIYHPILP